ncbi:uncharacterized protein LOC134827241 [Culicoides brevitarsis]|uniref:uncharacterized protein LOC134827241 n=1 Tax=Culicoides brevitarsis TaxID=469753 RepID=UPI00307BCB41
MDIKKQSTIFILNFFTKFSTEAKLKTGFERFGPIESVHILETPEKEIIGYVEFRKKDSAIQAIDTMDGMTLPNGKSMKLGFVKECNDSINNLYVKNVPESIDENVLESLFKKYGEIVSATIMRDAGGKSRGFGFVCFKSEVDAAVAKKDMNGFEIGGKKFDISFAQRKENRMAYLTAQKKGILKFSEERNKLPLEQRIVRRPTQLELQSYCSVPCLQQIPPPYGSTNVLEWQRHQRMMSTSAWKIPMMSEVASRLNNSQRFVRQNNNQKLENQNSRAFRSQANLSGTKETKKDENKPKSAESKGKEEKPSNMTEQDKKTLLQQLLLPQVKRLYPPYAQELMDRIMEREYKDIFRLAKNPRLLSKTANAEVQKIKQANNGAKRSSK